MRRVTPLFLVAAASAVAALLLVATRAPGAPVVIDPVLRETTGGSEQAAELRADVLALEGQIARQQQRISDLQRATDALHAEAETLAQSGETMRTEAGDTALAGPGVEIRLSDAPRERVQDSGPNYNINWFLVHDRDVLRVLNLLKGAGAEALAVNGVRLDTGTAVHCGGPAIYLRDIALTPPFLISAIGDPAALTAAIKGPAQGSPSDVYLELTSYGLVFDVKESVRVRIPSNHSTEAAGNASRAAQ